MERRAAKELLHIQAWLERVGAIVSRGKDTYLSDDLLQEAGDSLMMKLGEAANRLAKLGVLAPEGIDWALAVANRNFIIHQYDQINREITWLTISVDLLAWQASLQVMFEDAGAALDEEAEGPAEGQGMARNAGS